MSISFTTTIEPFRKGTSFTHWVERLEFFFLANKIAENDRKSHFITLSGSFIYSELRKLFPTGDLLEVSLAVMVEKLKARLDKTASGVCQRITFNQRVQDLDESVEDFLLALKIQAELCAYGEFKDTAIRDRLLAGLKDVALKQRILSDPDQTLETAEKIIQTWEAARSNAQTLSANISPNFHRIAAMGNGAPAGTALHRLAQVYNKSRNYKTNYKADRNRMPVKSRLGFQPQYIDRNSGYQYRNNRYKNNFQKPRSVDWRRRGDQSVSDPRFCDFCRMQGHLKRKCYKLKNMRKDSVQLLEQMKPGTSGTNVPDVSELLNRMTTQDSEESDDSDSGGNFKRSNKRT
ncbi:uncharacterized protein LOC134225238 [Armigeres subalbatus]|uniref:uncharacterized protein LOC134225238 n=1 Tax=Armigeres subalbatus TaxID=124917 RepID=UPI002ED540ED